MNIYYFNKQEKSYSLFVYIGNINKYPPISLIV